MVALPGIPAPISYEEVCFIASRDSFFGDDWDKEIRDCSTVETSVSEGASPMWKTAVSSADTGIARRGRANAGAPILTVAIRSKGNDLRGIIRPPRTYFRVAE
ncbi:hypothetical protein EVAR_51523_1 [Eumeta japonica]|uniref:Uncharacterized protein n=1 Tax=Eumeta variegata TaxID=151549 RepID=A0A4C1XCZ3_EUMVA|nr:hypothetical protein EVAR_51523_1 [Eumeta japonica]